MGNGLQKFIYNVSAAAPIGITFAIVWYIQQQTYIIPIIAAGFSLMLMIAFYMSFSYGLRHLAPMSIRTSDISPNDGWVVVYIITYLAPFGSIVIDDFNLLVCGGIAVLIALAAPYVNTAIPNPLLSVRKYHFYQVSAEHGISDYVLISKKKYRRKQDLKYINRMFDFILIDAERN